MEKSSIKAENIRLAELKYYDSDHNGIMFMEPLSYVILFKKDDCYVNLLKPEESYPVFERVPYTNMTVGGESFGTKVRLLTEEDKCQSGPCWLLDRIDFRKCFTNDVTIHEVENYVLNSSYFFKDRVDIVKNRMKSFRQPIRMLNILKKEEKRAEKVDEFFVQMAINKKKVK